MAIDRERALELARSEAERSGLLWEEPTRVNWGPFHYTVWTNANAIGGNLIISVHRRTGTVKITGPTPI